MECWGDIRDDFMRYINDFHANRKLVKYYNFIFIALIPKTSSPQKLFDFHSISLVGCMYKTIIKCMITWVLVKLYQRFNFIFEREINY